MSYSLVGFDCSLVVIDKVQSGCNPYKINVTLSIKDAKKISMSSWRCAVDIFNKYISDDIHILGFEKMTAVYN